MTNNMHFDVIIVGGSYSGLAAAMALGRSLKHVVVIDSGKPCNRQTPHSHNFITQDGKPPHEIAMLAREQVERYKTVMFVNGLALDGAKMEKGFQIRVDSGETLTAKKLIFATGVKDIMPNIEGFAECWGISVLHCPYCHGYEVKNERTGIMANGDDGFEFACLISNWTKDATLFTNGPSTLTSEQTVKIEGHNIRIVESEIEKLEHINGHLQNIIFKNSITHSLKALYTRSGFEQYCHIPETLGCELTDEGYIKIDPFQKTTVDGVYACGDNTTRMRTVASAVAMGTAAGMMINKEIVFEEF